MYFEYSSDEIKYAFAKSLKELRNYTGLSLIELENLTKINNPSLSRYENGKVEPSLSQAIIIAEAFSLNIEDFINCGLNNKNLLLERKTITDIFNEKIAELIRELGDNAKKMLQDIYHGINIEEILKEYL